MTLLGQNVNSYRDTSEDYSSAGHLSRGFSTIYKTKEGGRRFSDLLHEVAQVSWSVDFAYMCYKIKLFIKLYTQ